LVFDPLVLTPLELIPLELVALLRQIIVASIDDTVPSKELLFNYFTTAPS
jgi:hypothetical protein